MSTLQPGDRIADRYRVENVIARGGMGAVYRATDERLGRSVAVKVLLAELGQDQTSIARFEREATATAQLSHPGIVSVLDFGKTPEGVSYLVMEHVVGTTLADVLDRGRLAPARAADIVEQALGALAVAHAAGIVHRDLKPGNLMLVPVGAGGREIVKVLDFGIAQLKASAAYSRLTKTGAVIGTPSFMSPEQARGEPCDERTDVYAMGMVLWCCLTGARPFKKADLAALIQAVQTEVPPRADQLVPEVSRELGAITARALEKKPADRFATASSLASALVAVRATSSTPVGNDGGPTLAHPSAAATAPLPSAMAPSPIAPPRPAPDAATLPIPRPAAPVAPAQGVAPIAPVPATPAAKRRLWPRVVGCLLVLSLGAAVFVIAIAILGIAYLKQSGLLPAFPSLTSSDVWSVPSGSSAPLSDDPSYGEPLCAQAIHCCHAYTERVEDMLPSCEQVVGFSQGDATSCRRQLDTWRDLAIEREVPLYECE